MSEPHELSAQAFWRAEFANAALAVHASATRDLRVRLSGAAAFLRWVVIGVLAIQAAIVLNAWGVAGVGEGVGDISLLGLRLSVGSFPQGALIVGSFVAMGFFLTRALDDVASHRAQTQTLDFVGKNLMARMRYEEWRDQILSAASNDRSIFLARCTGIVREFCRSPGASREDFEAVRTALRAEAPEPNPTLDIMNALDFSDHAQLKTLIAGKKREFKDYVRSIKRRMSESFVDLEQDPEFARISSEIESEGDALIGADLRRRRFARAMRHFTWLDQSRDAVESGMPAYQLEGMTAFLIHDNFLEGLNRHFSKARRLFLWSNAGFLAVWALVNIAHVASMVDRAPRW